MDQQKSFPEVVGTEKQMLAAIYSKGVLHDDVLDLYRRIRSGYGRILSNAGDGETTELQEVEYHLWKLHYQLIDEFRKRIRRQSLNTDNIKNDDNNTLEVFKSFLSEASEFYRTLIVKLRTSSGLPPEIFLNNEDHALFPTRLQACEHTCHRLLICLGDLARYAEFVKKSDACDWSIAAKYYLEATRTWPDSGNPHNQLALLATYVGDSFLALYHCVRSLAVKEPFPDAWKNVMLLFEENRSAKFPEVSGQMEIDFLNPSTRIYTSSSQNGNVDMLEENILCEKFDLWPILVRTISFFFVESRFEEFPSTLASAVSSLEALLSLDDAKLITTLECYQNVDASRRGPYRAIHLVSMFIFTAYRLSDCPDRENDHKPSSASTPLALAAIFICMGRFTEQCLTRNRTIVDPLLPAIVVFVEWLAGGMDTVETYCADKKVKSALSYFLASLGDLLDRIEGSRDGVWDSPDSSALWEDHELRGFYPLAPAHERLDFTVNFNSMDDYASRNDSRLKRLHHAATRIIDRSSEHEEGKTCEVISSKIQGSTDEEEVILFKPITRRNSAPLYISKPAMDPMSTTQTSASDEFLRRATSLSTGHNTDDADSFSFYTTGNSRLKEPNTNAPTHPTGPPSLSAWVLSQGTSNVDKIPTGFSKQKLTPIDEVASTSFSHLTINDSKPVAPGLASTIIHETPPFITPTPSAPLLPDDAAWLRGNSIISPAGSDTDGILGAPPISPYNVNRVRPPISFATPLPGTVDGYPPPLLGMSSSEWLYHYRNSQNIGASGNHHAIPPIHFNPVTAYGNYHKNEVSGFDVCDQWGNHLVSNPTAYVGSVPNMYPSSSPVVYGGTDEQKRERLFLGYQRPFPYVCGVGMELGSEQQLLVQYLKEKERQMQGGSQLRNHHHHHPTYMGN